MSRSPIYSHFNETVQGVVVIRAFGEQQRFVLEAHGRVDTNQEAYFPRFVATRYIHIPGSLLSDRNKTYRLLLILNGYLHMDNLRYIPGSGGSQWIWSFWGICWFWPQPSFPCRAVQNLVLVSWVWQFHILSRFETFCGFVFIILKSRTKTVTLMHWYLWWFERLNTFVLSCLPQIPK